MLYIRMPQMTHKEGGKVQNRIEWLFVGVTPDWKEREPGFSTPGVLSAVNIDFCFFDRKRNFKIEEQIGGRATVG